MKGLHRLLHKEKTIIYFEMITVLIRVFKCLQWIRPNLRGRLGLYFSTLDEQYKRTTMKKFVDGDILILLATKAAGMGVDIPDVVQVIQYSHIEAKPVIRGRWPRHSKEEKALALQELLSWRKGAFKKWQATQRYVNGAETGILLDITAKKLSQQFSQVRTAEAVATFASSSNWFPRGNPRHWFVEITQLLTKLNMEIDDGLVLSSQLRVAMAPDLPNDSSEDDDNGSNDEEDR
ncbi:hypothetical protein CPB97_002954 [Podila verticillata]|nr:hypothetical protein CPB97_002954 [Podila verticillata]